MSKEWIVELTIDDLPDKKLKKKIRDAFDEMEREGIIGKEVFIDEQKKPKK